MLDVPRAEAVSVAVAKVRVLGEVDRYEEFASGKMGRGFECGADVPLLIGCSFWLWLFAIFEEPPASSDVLIGVFMQDKNDVVLGPVVGLRDDTGNGCSEEALAAQG